MDRSSTAGERWCGAASALLPLLLYTFTAAPSPTWLDTAEFLVAGFVLGTAHPPGHPLEVILIKFFTFLPLGPLAFRASLASAAAAAGACYLCFRLFLTITRAVDGEAPRWLQPLFALVGALLLAVSPALWWQATRAEVYGLQALAITAVLVQLAPYGLAEKGTGDRRLVVAAAFLFGLSLTNHHFLSLTLLPGLVVFFTLVALRDWRDTVRVLARGALPAATLGLLPYLHLWLRAGAKPHGLSLGAAADGPTFLWVVSARAFQKAVTEPLPDHLGQRMAEVTFMLFENLGALVVILALGGLYFLVRQAPPFGGLLAVTALSCWAIRSWMGFDPQNPDMHGYLLPAVAIGAVAAARVGPMAATLPIRQTLRIGIATVAGAILVATVAFQLQSKWEAADLSHARAAEVVVQQQLVPLASRSVVITENFNTGFNVWAAQTIEGHRPDIIHFHVTFLGFPGYVDQIHRRFPELRGVLRAALVQGELPVGEVSSLAQRRPVYVEPPLGPTEDVLRFLRPAGLLWAASGEPLSRTDIAVAIPDHVARWKELLGTLGSDHDEQTARYLVWRLYLDGLALARIGQQEAAIQLVGEALALVPQSPELGALASALFNSEGPMEIEPFLPAPAATQPTKKAGVAPLDVLDF